METDDEASLSDAETQLLSLTDSITQLEIVILQLNSDYESLFGSSPESSQTDFNVAEHGECNSSDCSLSDLIESGIDVADLNSVERTNL